MCIFIFHTCFKGILSILKNILLLIYYISINYTSSLGIQIREKYFYQGVLHVIIRIPALIKNLSGKKVFFIEILENKYDK
jgi:hypothetical protein